MTLDAASFAPMDHDGPRRTSSTDVLSSRYDRWDDFPRLLRDHDPTGKFRNAWLDRHFDG